MLQESNLTGWKIPGLNPSIDVWPAKKMDSQPHGFSDGMLVTVAGNMAPSFHRSQTASASSPLEACGTSVKV